MVEKKGVSAAVAWVLLLGFSIGLATMVFLWTTRQTEDITKSTTRYIEGGMQCDNVMINVANSTCNPVKTCCLKVFNTRYLNVEKVVLRGLERGLKGVQPASVECTDNGFPLNVTEYMFCGQDRAPQNVTVMPIVKVNDELVACKNKAINIQC